MLGGIFSSFDVFVIFKNTSHVLESFCKVEGNRFLSQFILSW